MITRDQPGQLFFKPLMTTIFLGSLIAGCSSISEKPTNQHLQTVRDTYQEAQNNPQVAKQAAKELAKAAQLLRQAETAKTDEEIEQLVAQAQQQVQQAQAIAKRQAAKAAEQARLRQRQPQPEVVQACEETNTRRLEDLLHELNNSKTGRGWVLLLENEVFKTGKADLLPTTLRTLNKVATFLKYNPNQQAMIENHSEDLGDRNFTLGLSQRRAEEVRFTLVKCGIASNRIMAKGLSSNLPVANRNRSSGHEQQRVEIIILNAGEQL